MRALFNEEAFGTVVAIHFEKQTVDIGIISEKYHLSVDQLFKTSPCSFKTNVYRIQKSASSGVPSGLSNIFDNMKVHKRVGLFTAEIKFHAESKLMQQFYEYLKTNNMQQVDYTQQALEVLMHINEKHRTQLIDNCKYSLASLEFIYKNLNTERFIQNPQVNMKAMCQKFSMEAKEIEKSSTFQSIVNLRDLPSSQKYFSICSGADQDVLYKSIQQLKTGTSSLSLQSQKQLSTLNITTAHQAAVTGSVGRVVIVCQPDLKTKIQQGMEFIAKLHELSLEQVQIGVTAEKLAQKIKEIKQDSFSEDGVSVVMDLPDLNQTILVGYSQGGVLVSSEAQKARNGLVLTNQQFELAQDMAVQIRTSGLVQVAGIKFVASIMDIIIPNEQPQRSITSPFLYKASTSVVLRDYYTIVAVGVPQHSQPQRQSEQPAEAVVMESSSSESSEKQKVDTNEVLARLKQEMHEKMLKRLPTQKLICDLQENTELPTAFESVEEMNRQVQVVKHGILLGDPMYLMINGRPLPLMAQHIFGVTLNEDAECNQIKIKFIAPGQIIGKKEFHPQVSQYQDATFLKELIFETSQANMAQKIKKELLEYKAKGDKLISKQQQEMSISLAIDPDNLMDRQLKQFLTQPEAPKTKSVGPPLDRNVLGGALMLKPKLQLKSQKGGKKDMGELYICENGLRYKLIPSVGPSIESFIGFKQIRNIYYEKFTNSNHTAVICVQLWHKVRMSELLLDKKMAAELQAEKQQYDFISFICSLESDTKLGTSNDREDQLAERQKLEQMKRASGYLDKFIQNVNDQVTKYEEATGIKDLAKYICRVAKHTKDLRMEASVDQQSLQRVFSYSNNSLGCFNKKVSAAINLDDVEMVVFENVSISQRRAFQAAFIYKDVRIEPFMLKQIEFDYITQIQAYLLKKGIFYAEINDSQAWSVVKTNLNKERDVFEKFVTDGGWIDFLGLNESQHDDDDDEEPSGSVFEEDEDVEYSEYSDVKSESKIEESGDDDDYYDWDRSD